MMMLRNPPFPSDTASSYSDIRSGGDVYNILPLHDLLADNEALRFPEVRAALNALDGSSLPDRQFVRQLQQQQHAGGAGDSQSDDGASATSSAAFYSNDGFLLDEDVEVAAPPMDMVSWLGFVFGFQPDNVKNQREHIVLLLANYQMRIQPPPTPIDVLDRRATAILHKKLLKNYSSWCSFLQIPTNFISPAAAGAASSGFFRRRRDAADSPISHLRRHRHLFLRLLFPHRLRRHKASDLDLCIHRHPSPSCFLCSPDSPPLSRRHIHLLYSCLFLLIWGESANLRFMSECLCYIFHHLAFHLNVILLMQHCHPLEAAVSADDDTASAAGDELHYDDDFGGDDGDPLRLLSFYDPQKNGFLHHVVTPIYRAVRAEAMASKDGRAPHSAWRNYDDMNEFFWNRYCFSLGWPPSASPSPYLRQSIVSVPTKPLYPPWRSKMPPPPAAPEVSRQSPPPAPEKIPQTPPPVATFPAVGKTGFVEQRSFLNIYHSFDHMWTGLILMLQAMMIMAFNDDGLPWDVVHDMDVQAALLTVFITWSGLRLLQVLLDIAMQYSDVRFGRVRAVLKLLSAASWTAIFAFSQAQMWEQRIGEGGWTAGPSAKLRHLRQICAAFVLPEISALLLSVLPFLRNAAERTEWRIVHLLTWWFQTRMFVARGLTENIVDNARYTVFWLSVLSAKFTFSYFLQVKPLVEPTRELLHLRSTDVSLLSDGDASASDRFLVAVVWAPVVLVYLMDLQIWYAVFSSALGAMLGLSEHIGEIRNIQQLKLRFPFFASATTFNILAPQEGLFATAGDDAAEAASRLLQWRWWTSWIGDMLRRVMLRYGLGKDYRKFESDTMEARKFAYIWNEIVAHIREEDLISDQEQELLEIPLAAADGTGGGYAETVQWPCVFISNEILIALRICEDFRGIDDKRLWAKISKNEYRRCAVLESYHSVKQLVFSLLADGSDEHRLLESLFEKMEEHVKDGTFCRKHRLEMLPEIHARVLALVHRLLKPPPPPVTGGNKVSNVVNALQHLYDVVTKDFLIKEEETEAQEGWKKLQRRASRRAARRTGWPLLFVESVRLPECLISDNGDDDDDDPSGLRRRLRRLRTILTAVAMDDVPRNADARRRIAFFSNSIFMNMPRAPLVERMLSFSVLTPYYDEDVMYSFEKLRMHDAGRPLTMLSYLQSINQDEWRNWLERMDLKRLEDPLPEPINTELRLWASYRGQTLSRTVRGMMYYMEALETLAYLDTASEVQLQQEGGGRRSRRRRGEERSEDGGGELSEDGSERSEGGGGGVETLKFTYVVACQLYGAHKAKGDAKAADIQFLMKKHPAMRVAYVHEDKEPEDGGPPRFYSVLAKHCRMAKKEVEVYRIELPGHPKLGEGKPENQNHALIFTRGDAMQAIDMNQDHYFEEALKMRNLLQEFRRRRRGGGAGSAQLLGVREHVFTGTASSLAWFMSAQETSFVTLGQRVLGAVLKARMHYGHPDVFDRLWFLSRGGISKASRSINVSEDIFAGFNCTLRGGSVTHHEYIQVGKGRDVGLNQIANFEAKVSSGNAEQMLSRDVYRLAHRLDFFRMLSFYYTTVGFYVSSMITILTVYAFLWGRVYLALSGADAAISAASDAGDAALAASMNQQFLVQLGMVTALPMVVENSLEHGFSRAAWDFLTMQLELCSVFFTFSLGTKGHYFGRTLLHGGARYRATGRDFVIRREKFTDNYRLFSRSHFVKAAEIIVLLIIYAVYGGRQRQESAAAGGAGAYVFLTASSWCLALSWILAPFLFNPWGFQWTHLVRDVEDFHGWLWHGSGGAIIAKAEESWEVWWAQSHDHLRTTGMAGKAMEVVLSLRFFVLHYGLLYRMHMEEGERASGYVYLLSWGCVAAAVGVGMGVEGAERMCPEEKRIKYQRYRVLAGLVVVPAGGVALLAGTPVTVSDIGVGMVALAATGWGMISVCVVFKGLVKRRWRRVWRLVVTVARFYELALGALVLIPLGILSWLPGFQEIQTRILFNRDLPPLPFPTSRRREDANANAAPAQLPPPDFVHVPLSFPAAV